MMAVPDAKGPESEPLAPHRSWFIPAAPLPRPRLKMPYSRTTACIPRIRCAISSAYRVGVVAAQFGIAAAEAEPAMMVAMASCRCRGRGGTGHGHCDGKNRKSLLHPEFLRCRLGAERQQPGSGSAGQTTIGAVAATAVHTVRLRPSSDAPGRGRRIAAR